MEQKNAERVVLTVCSEWETSVEQSSVLIPKVRRDSLCHRRPSCFRFTQLSAFPARTPQNSSFVKALHPLLQAHILYPLFLDVAVERSSWQFRTRQATHSRMRVIVIVCHHLLRCAFPMVHCIPNKIDAQIHNGLTRYPLLNIVDKVGKQYTLELLQIVYVWLRAGTLSLRNGLVMTERI